MIYDPLDKVSIDKNASITQQQEEGLLPVGISALLITLAITSGLPCRRQKHNTQAACPARRTHTLPFATPPNATYFDPQQCDATTAAVCE